MDDRLFWQLTPQETVLLMTERAERELAEQRAANLRAGLVAATIINMTPRKSRRTYRPEDFLRDPDAGTSDTPDALRAALLAWGAETRGVTVT